MAFEIPIVAEHEEAFRAFVAEFSTHVKIEDARLNRTNSMIYFLLAVDSAAELWWLASVWAHRAPAMAPAHAPAYRPASLVGDDAAMPTIDCVACGGSGEDGVGGRCQEKRCHSGQVPK